MKNHRVTSGKFLRRGVYSRQSNHDFENVHTAHMIMHAISDDVE